MNKSKFNLDHFLTSCPPDDFGSLKQLIGRWKNVKHIQSFNGTAFFESIYITTKDGHYIELINRKDPTNIVNAIVVNTFSSPLKDESDLEAIVGEKLNWERTNEVRKVSENDSLAKEDIEKDWFYVWFINDKIAQDENTGIWLIDYQDNKFNTALSEFNPEEYDFKQVLEVKWSLPSRKFGAMKAVVGWSTDDLTIADDILIFSLNNPNGKEIKFEFKKNDHRKPGYEAITLEKMVKNKEFSLQDSSFIELQDENEHLTLKFNEY